MNSTTRQRLLDIYQQTAAWAKYEKIVTDAELNPAISGPIWSRMHAHALAAQQKYSAALDRIREAMAMDPQDRSYARDFLVILLQAHDTESVIRETQRMLDKGDRDWWIYHMRGMARLVAGKKPEAIELLDKAIAAADQIKSDDALQQVIDSFSQFSLDDAIKRLAGRLDQDNWRLQSVMLHMRKTDYDGAMAILKPLLERRASLRRSDRISAIRFAAECKQFGGHPLEALPYYLEWDKESPNDSDMLNNMAYLLADDLKRPRDGLKYSQRAYDIGRKLNQQDPMVVDTQGWVLTLCGDSVSANEGLTILSELVDSHPDFLDARYHFAMAYIKRNRMEDGARQLKICIDQIKTLEDKKSSVRPELKLEIQTEFEKVKQYAQI